MKAEEALRQSENNEIVAVTVRGRIAMSRTFIPTNYETEAFQLRFMSRDTKGQSDSTGAVAIGSYDDLDIAVTIAAIGYGVAESHWVPGGQV